MTIAAPSLPYQNTPFDVFIGFGKQMTTYAVSDLSSFANGNNPTDATNTLLWYLRPSTQKQQAGANAARIDSVFEFGAAIGSFRSFSTLKRTLGPAGPDMAWHHIVEQSKVGEFGAEAVHNVSNVVRVPSQVNSRLNAYSSKQTFTNGLTTLAAKYCNSMR